MSARDIVSINQTRAAIGHGSNVVANEVTGALAPRRRNEVIEKSWCAPTMLMDGVTVANEIELDGIAPRPLDMAGDGTITAAMLAQAIYVEGAELVAPGANPTDIERNVEDGVADIVEHVRRPSEPTNGKTEIVQAGTISARFPKLDAVMRRQKRLQVMTFYIPALAFTAAGIVFASWLLGWA
jgi:chaperonin GroEL